MAPAIPQACLASSAIRCRDVETGPNRGVLAVFPSNGATCRCPLGIVKVNRLEPGRKVLPPSTVAVQSPTYLHARVWAVI